MKRLAILAASAATLFWVSSAGAVTLTFEGVSNTIYTAPITRSGVVIGNPTGQEQHFHEIDSTAYSLELPSNGTGVLFNDRNTQLQFTLTAGGTFTLGAFDTAALIASGNPFGGATLLQVTSFLGATQVAQFSYAINSNGYTTYSGATLGVFDRLLFDGLNGGGGFVLDNVNINAAATGGVPEPTTWAMMMLGFGGMGYAMRRRSRVGTRIRFA